MIGTELDGRYRILKQLGTGGMGEVYLAAVTDRAVAVAAKRAPKEEELVELCRSVGRVITDLVARFDDHTPVRQLHDRLRSAEGMLTVAEHAAGRRG